ncbi:MAG: hypothetical protein QOH70_2065 [Blastocatellia bacterium]|jgi:HEAT repeat protein|nr:hypothetical protein [Blastocatellia bacterium]
MTFAIQLIIWAVLNFSATCGSLTSENGHLPNIGFGSTPSRTSNSGCDTDLYIQTALQKLTSGEYTEIEQARNNLLGYAKKSSACRNEVIRSLMKDMDKPDLNLEKQSSNYYLWREGSQLLGELKALEALDLLISHLHLTNGLHSASMVYQPAILGVRQMGPQAVPKLSIALRQSPNPNIRIAAAYCLTSIGGISAMNALKSVQDSESNKCVAGFIALSMKTFSYKAKSGLLMFDNAAPQANVNARKDLLTAFECID